MPDQIVELPTYADLLDVTDRHPVPLYNLEPGRLRGAWALRSGPTGTVAWSADHPRRGRGLTAIGSPGDVAVLVSRIVATGADVDHITVPVGTVPLLPFAVGSGADWDWFWTTAPPAPRAGEDAVTGLDTTDGATLAGLVDLLDIGAPGASVRPGTRESARSDATAWSGICGRVDGAERLLACAAHSVRIPGVAHLSSITTRPDHRGRGLAGDLTAAITRRELGTGARAVTLGMYADNDVARHVYEKLGFCVGQAFSSRSLGRPVG